MTVHLESRSTSPSLEGARWRARRVRLELKRYLPQDSPRNNQRPAGAVASPFITMHLTAPKWYRPRFSGITDTVRFLQEPGPMAARRYPCPDTRQRIRPRRAKRFRPVRFAALDFTLFALLKLQPDGSGLMPQPQMASPEAPSRRFRRLSLANWPLLDRKKSLPFQGPGEFTQYAECRRRVSGRVSFPSTLAPALREIASGRM